MYSGGKKWGIYLFIKILCFAQNVIGISMPLSSRHAGSPFITNNLDYKIA